MIFYINVTELFIHLSINLQYKYTREKNGYYWQGAGSNGPLLSDIFSKNNFFNAINEKDGHRWPIK